MAEERTERPPRIENEIQRYITPARSHMFAAVATGDPRLLHPDSKLQSKEIIKGLENDRHFDLRPLACLTWESRYKGLNGDKKEIAQVEFDEQMKKWLERTQKWINYTATEGENKDLFIETLKSLEIENIDSAAQDFYDMFLDAGDTDTPHQEAQEKLQDGLGYFINSLIEGCIKNDDLNIDKLSKRLKVIRPLLKTFGTEFEAYKRLEDSIMILVLPKEDDIQAFADMLAANSEVSDKETRKSLIKLAEYAGVNEVKTEEEMKNIEAAEQLFARLKRPFTIEDVKAFQEAFRAREERKRSKGQNWNGPSKDEFYNFLAKGKLLDQIPDAQIIAPEKLNDKKAYDDFLLNLYTKWRQNMIEHKDFITFQGKLAENFGNVEGLPEVSSADELRQIFRKHRELRYVTPMFYQKLDPNPGELIAEDEPYLHIRGERWLGYPKVENEDSRIYLNPPIDSVPHIARAFIKTASKERIPFYFKMIDYALDSAQLMQKGKKDRIVFFTDKENIIKIISILEEIKGEHPEWFIGRELPMLTAKVSDGIGIAEEPSQYQHDKFHDEHEKRVSFNSVRAKFFESVWRATTKDILLQGPETQITDGKTIKEIFEDNIRKEIKERHYRLPTQEDAEIIINKIWKSQFDQDKLDKDAKSEMDKALTRTMSEVIAYLNVEEIFPYVSKQIQTQAMEFGIDPDNIAVNFDPNRFYQSLPTKKDKSTAEVDTSQLNDHELDSTRNEEINEQNESSVEQGETEDEPEELRGVKEMGELLIPEEK